MAHRSHPRLPSAVAAALVVTAAAATLAGCGSSSGTPGTSAAATSATSAAPSGTATLSTSCPPASEVAGVLGGTSEENKAAESPGICDYGGQSGPEVTAFRIFFYSLGSHTISALQSGIVARAKAAGGSAVQSVPGLGDAAFGYTMPAVNDPSETTSSLWVVAGDAYVNISGDLTVAQDGKVAELLLK